MKDHRRLTAFKVLLAARERQLKQLEKQRLALTHQRSELLQAVQAKQMEIEQQVRVQQEHQGRIDKMVNHAVLIKPSEFNALRQYLEIIIEQRLQLESDQSRLQQALQQKEKEIHDVQQRIAKNNGQIDAYQKLIDRIRLTHARAAENALDEQVGEALLAQQRLRACI